jgi:hypothetical protein
MMARPAILMALVAISVALPSNYEQMDSLFKETSQGALDRVIEEPNSEEPVTPFAAFKKQDAPATPDFKDDPLASTVEGGQAEEFMSVFTQKLNKLERIPSGQDMVMPPAIELSEAATQESDINLHFKKPSQPISQGFAKQEESTANEVSKEDNVEKEGLNQETAEEVGKKIAAKETAKAAAAPKTAGKAQAKKEKKLSKEKTKPAAVSVGKKGTLKSSKQSKTVHPKKPSKNSASSLRGATYFTVGLTMMTAIVVGAF